MPEQSRTKIKSKLTPKSTTSVIAISGIVLVVALIMLLMPHQSRSVNSYCKVYIEEKKRLVTMSNDANPYPSGVFNVSVTDAGQIAGSFGKLDPVAPKEIEPEVKSLQKLYQDIHDNPSHAITNALNGGSLDDSLKAWTAEHCRN